MSKPLNGLTSAEHLEMDAKIFQRPLIDKISGISFPTVISLGEGSGRDITDIYNSKSGAGRFIAVDYSATKLEDAKQAFPELIREAKTIEDITPITDDGKIAYLVADVLELNLAESLRADAMLALALTMFVPPDDIPAYAQSIERNLASGGTVFEYHSIYRPDPPADSRKTTHYPAGHHWHQSSTLLRAFRKTGLSTYMSEPVNEVGGRGFDFLSIEATKPEAIL